MKTLDMAYWRRAFDNLAAAFDREKLRLCELDGAIGDGDHGSSMARGFTQAKEHIFRENPDTIAGLFKITGNAFLANVGGVSGVIFGTLFLEAGKKAEGLANIIPEILADMLGHSLTVIKKRGKVKEGDKSMVDAFSPVVETLKRLLGSGAEFENIMPALRNAAEEGMKATESMAAKVGRVRYQKDKGVGHIDSGAASMALIFQTLNESL